MISDIGVTRDRLWFSFEAPTRPLSENESRTMHWGSRNRRLNPWKDITLEGWESVSAEAWTQGLVGHFGVVQLHLPFNRTEKQWAADRRDPHNYVSTMCKVVVDVLTDKTKGKTILEPRLWPDDTPEWVKVLEPILVRGTEAKLEITFPGDD